MNPKKFYSTLKNQYTIYKENHDHTYLEYVWQRFIHTPLEYKINHIPTVFQNHIIKNTYFDTYSYPSQKEIYIEYCINAVGDLVCIEQLLERNIRINIVTDLYIEQLVILKEKYGFLLSICSQSYESVYEYNFLGKSLKNQILGSQIALDCSCGIVFLYITESGILEKIPEIIINYQLTTISYDMLNSYAIF